ncbi:hypothetical protein B0T14DRAFT_564161 [Immersiella caudata]|uniref:Histone chaperone domain-containing protein n=1 Tax=Immersiella caudata TaxID=314043 RepID=A0AA39WWB8_9PEZI|nr:hypothetical protein B0T14DRAFT_564161 [Immersiella caudata]
MSKSGHAYTDDKLGAEIPEGAPEDQMNDPSYKSRRGDREPIAVIDDDAPVEDPIKESEADSDKQLERDDREAIDTANIVKGTTSRAKPVGTYAEPTDEQMGLME